MKADREYLESLKAELVSLGLPVRTHLAMGDPASELVRVAEEQEVDLVAMSTHGHRFLSDVIHGATADRVRHLAEGPGPAPARARSVPPAIRRPVPPFLPSAPPCYKVPLVAEPRAIHTHAIDDLRYIRDTMAQAGRFSAIPGWGGVVDGRRPPSRRRPSPDRPPTRDAGSAVWLAEAAIAVVIARRGHREEGTPIRARRCWRRRRGGSRGSCCRRSRPAPCSRRCSPPTA